MKKIMEHVVFLKRTILEDRGVTICTFLAKDDTKYKYFGITGRDEFLDDINLGEEFHIFGFADSFGEENTYRIMGKASFVSVPPHHCTPYEFSNIPVYVDKQMVVTYRTLSCDKYLYGFTDNNGNRYRLAVEKNSPCARYVKDRDDIFVRGYVYKNTGSSNIYEFAEFSWEEQPMTIK